MFQYRKETIINVNDTVNGLAKWSILPAIAPSTEDTLFVRHIGKYPAATIASVVTYPHIPAALAQTTITLPAVGAATVVRKLVIKIRLDGEVEASYANSMTYFHRPFEIEYTADKTHAEILAIIVKAVQASEYDFTASLAGAVLTLDAVDCYQRFEICQIEEFTPRAVAFPYEGTWAIVAAGTVVVEGTQGFGTYEQLLKNLRLPTMEATRWVAEHREERPIVGASYYLTQIIMDSGVRNIGGGGVVGSRQNSITTHDFWVNTAIVEDFAADADAVFATKRVVRTVVG